MKKISKIALGLTATAMALGLYINNQCFVAKEEKVTLTSEKIKNPIKITQISCLLYTSQSPRD